MVSLTDLQSQCKIHGASQRKVTVCGMTMNTTLRKEPHHQYSTSTFFWMKAIEIKHMGLLRLLFGSENFLVGPFGSPKSSISSLRKIIDIRPFSKMGINFAQLAISKLLVPQSRNVAKWMMSYFSKMRLSLQTYVSQFSGIFSWRKSWNFLYILLFSTSGPLGSR